MKVNLVGREKRLLWLSFGAILSPLHSGCSSKTTGEKSDKNGQVTTVQTVLAPDESSGSFDPRPDDENSVEAKVSRYLGQTKFANINAQSFFSKGRSMEAESASVELDQGSAQKREIEDSDVFKVDEANKLVFLLSNYRGIQVVSYADGIENPKLVGRVAASGNYPEDMFFSNNQLVVVENNSFDSDHDYQSSESRVLVYKLDLDGASSGLKSKYLSLKKTYDMTGMLADKRRVGNILYVATNDWKYGQRSGFGEDQQSVSMGRIYSINLKTGEEKSLETSKPLSMNNTMGISQVKTKDGKWKYYVTAVLSDNFWGWGDTRSSVEVIDISSDEGEISHVMVAHPQGIVFERTQVLVKDNALIVVSNYVPNGDQAKQRLAVETFTFPTQDATTINESEAKYRKLHIERAVSKASLVFNSEEYNSLLTDKETGLRGVFVKSERQVTKLVSDSFTSAGDTNGLHAVIRDVRSIEDTLYVFWVPSDRARLFNDPLEVYDIKDVHSVKHVDHLEFPGRIDRSFPVSYKNKNYILALGVVMPAIDNENNSEKTQAMLIEFLKRDGKLKANIASHMLLSTPNLRANLQGEDKMVSMVSGTGEETDKGFVLFEANQNGGSFWKRGGKVVYYDMTKLDDGDAVFTEGEFIPAKEGYLRRVFYNSIVEGVNSFSDKVLAAFNISADSGKTSEIEPVSQLELSRDVAGYVSLQGPKGEMLGIQIVNPNGYFWESDTVSTEVRVVDASKADSELSEALSQTTLEGQYVTHFVNQAKTEILVVTSSYKTITDTTGYSYKVVAGHSFFKLTSGEGNDVVVSKKAYLERSNNESTYFKTLLGKNFVVSSEYNFTDGSQNHKIVQIDFEGLAQPKLSKVKGETCSTHLSDGNLEFKSINGFDFLVVRKYEDVAKTNLSMTLNYLVPVTITDGQLQCSKAISIPGQVVFVSDDHNTIVTQDVNSKALVELEPRAKEEGVEQIKEYEVYTKSNLVVLSLDLENSTATLWNLDALEDASYYSESAFTVIDNRLVYSEILKKESTFAPRFGFGEWGGGGMSGRVQESSVALFSLEVDASYNLIRSLLNVSKSSAIGPYASAPTVASVQSTGRNLKTLLLVQGSDVFAFELNVSSWKAAPLKLALKDVDFMDSEPTLRVKTPASYSFLDGVYYSYYSGSHPKLNYNSTLSSFEAASGDYGVIQLSIKK